MRVRGCAGEAHVRGSTRTVRVRGMQARALRREGALRALAVHEQSRGNQEAIKRQSVCNQEAYCGGKARVEPLRRAAGAGREKVARATIAFAERVIVAQRA